MTRGKDAVLTEPLMGHTLIDEQARLETLAIRDGAARYRRMVSDAIRRGEADKLKPVERLMAHWFDAVSILIEDEQKACAAGEPGQGRVIYGPVIRSVDADRLAVIALQEVVNACIAEPDGVKTANLAYKVGRGVLAEIEATLLKSQDPEAYRELFTKYRHADDRKIRASWGRIAGKPTAKARVCIQVGAVLVDAIVRAASVTDYDDDVFEPAFTEENRKRHRGSVTMPQSFVTISNAALEIIDHGHASRQILRPRYLPMVVRPYLWTEDAQGGYIRIRTPLISKPSREQKERLDAADKSTIYKALDVLGGAAIRLDRRVYAVQREVWENGGGELRVPSRSNVEMDRPFPEGADSETIKQWKIDAIKVHRENIRIRGDREDYIRYDWMASEFLDRDPIYLPHKLDFRGRVFPIPTHLNHHGDDVARAALEFSEPKDAGDDDSQYWIRVHAANCYGFDKVSFDEQVRWVESHTAEIARTVAEPLSFDWWKQADKPWQFLQACYALTDPEAAARLPVQRDGTVNGMQHYVALSRDEGGAPFVNLEPADRPGDLYSAVLEVVRKRVEADQGRAEARRVLPLLSRKVVKQTVMTVVYGVTRHGASEQVRARLKEAGLKGETLYKCSGYLSGVVLDSIGELCDAASAAMRWLTDCARLITAENMLVGWTTPVGMPVLQPYRKESAYRVKTMLRWFNLRHADRRAPVWVKKQIDGVAPNFIHSIDASHLMMTAIECDRAGVTIQTVHDAYRTHAATVGEMDCILRDQFVELHRRPLLETLAEQWGEAYPGIDFPSPPGTGSFDLNRVMDSLYFFS